MADRGRIEEAIEAWRDGATYEGVHPIDSRRTLKASFLYDPNAVKDLARVIAHMLDGETPPDPP
jgi:hypothetical protein